MAENQPTHVLFLTRITLVLICLYDLLMKNDNCSICVALLDYYCNSNLVFFLPLSVSFSLSLRVTAAHFHHVIELLRFRQGTVSGIFLSAGNRVISLPSSSVRVVLPARRNYSCLCLFVCPFQCSSSPTLQYLELIQPLYSSGQVHLWFIFNTTDAYTT